MGVIMVISKDPKESFYKDDFDISREAINGIMAMIIAGDSIYNIKLPEQYPHSIFPNSDNEELVNGSLISLSGQFINNNQTILMDAGEELIFNVNPNMEPFKKWCIIKVKTSVINKSLNLSIKKAIDGTEIFNQTLNTSGDNEAIFDLNEYNIELEPILINITANTSNTEITNIIFTYDLTPDETDKIFKGLATAIQGLKADSAIQSGKIGDISFTKQDTELSLSAQQLLNVIKTVDGVSSGLDSEYLGGQRYDKFASRIQSDTKKFSELHNGDYIVGYNHIGSISGKFVTINLGSGDWISLDGYDFSSSENFEGAFNGSYVSSGMSTSEIDSCFTFEVQRQTPQDLIDVKKEIFDNIDKIKIETYNNGFRIKKNGVYIYSRCFGSVEMTTTGSNVCTYTTVNYPFTMTGSIRVSMANAMGDPLNVGASTDQTDVDSVRLTLKRVSAGSSSVRWSVESI